jgi:hypothetical protein
MGHVANFMGRVFARFRRDDGLDRSEGDTESPQPDVEQIRAQAFREGMEFAEIVRKVQEDHEEYMSPEDVLAQVEHDLNEIEYPGYVRDDDPMLH